MDLEVFKSEKKGIIKDIFQENSSDVVLEAHEQDGFIRIATELTYRKIPVHILEMLNCDEDRDMQSYMTRFKETCETIDTALREVCKYYTDADSVISVTFEYTAVSWDNEAIYFTCKTRNGIFRCNLKYAADVEKSVRCTLSGTTTKLLETLDNFSTLTSYNKDTSVYDKAVANFRSLGILLPDNEYNNNEFASCIDPTTHKFYMFPKSKDAMEFIRTNPKIVSIRNKAFESIRTGKIEEGLFCLNDLGDTIEQLSDNKYHIMIEKYGSRSYCMTINNEPFSVYVPSSVDCTDEANVCVYNIVVHLVDTLYFCWLFRDIFNNFKDYNLCSKTCTCDSIKSIKDNIITLESVSAYSTNRSAEFMKFMSIVDQHDIKSILSSGFYTSSKKQDVVSFTTDNTMYTVIAVDESYYVFIGDEQILDKDEVKRIAKLAEYYR